MFGSKKSIVKAVEDVSFSLHNDEVLVIAGESGSGKSTIAKLILGAITPDSGKVIFQGKEIKNNTNSLMKIRMNCQMVHQDPYDSINPRMKVRDIVSEPLEIHNIGHGSEREKIVLDTLREVKLEPAEEIANKYPHMLSGGQRQRVVLARALVLRPKIIIADEPVSMLDVSIRVEVLELMKNIQKKNNDYENLCVTGIIDSYESGLEFLKHYDQGNNLIIFLGSSFGNFSYENGLTFLQKINSSMKKSDLFLIGLDLVKDKTVLERAYNDSQDVTAKFNLNVLSRINSELDSDFNIRKFVHHAIYNESQSRVEIYLRSLENQTVNISKASMTLQIKQNELIHTENSCKYTIPKIKEMLSTTGFQIRDVWYDEKQHYCLVLFSKK